MANVIDATYPRRLMGSLRVIPSNTPWLFCVLIGCFSMAWYKRTSPTSVRLKAFMSDRPTILEFSRRNEKGLLELGRVVWDRVGYIINGRVLKSSAIAWMLFLVISTHTMAISVSLLKECLMRHQAVLKFFLVAWVPLIVLRSLCFRAWENFKL